MAPQPTPPTDDLTFTPPTAAPPQQATPAPAAAPAAPTTTAAAPEELTFTPPAATPPPSLGQRISDLGEQFIESMPGIGVIHEGAKAAGDWAQKELDKPTTQFSPAKTFGAGVVRDVAGLAKGATSPAGLAITAGTIAAPEIALPVGIGLAGQGLYSFIKGWGDFTNPDVLQNELMNAAQFVGGAAMVGQGVKGIRAHVAERAAIKAPTEEYTNFKNAVPPSKSAPYAELDYAAARPYLDHAQQTGMPIRDVDSLREAADMSVKQIEGKIENAIRKNPNAIVASNPINDVKQALKGNLRVDFYNSGMEALENWPLGFERVGGEIDPPLTLDRADAIRHQLNQENAAILKKNNYDVGIARTTDPGFLAREVAAESLRNGIYNKLDDLGFKDARALRNDEGSLLKIRNAAKGKEFGGEAKVKAGEKAGGVKRMAKKVAPLVGAGVGLAAGEAIGHPYIGMGMGEEAARIGAEHLLPETPTRNELIERAFEPRPKPVPLSAAQRLAAVPAQAVTQSPNKPILFRASDGSYHTVPAEQIDAARQADPDLQIVGR